MVSIPQRYIPSYLTKKDKTKQMKELKKSRKAYKYSKSPTQKYITRKNISSFKSRKSSHILNAQKIYNLKNVIPSKELENKTKCKLEGLKKIVNKGKGAYFSSGSRPNQTAHSWGYARLASAITGGKASASDFQILSKYCTKNSKALKMAKKNYTKKYKKGLRRVKSVQLK